MAPMSFRALATRAVALILLSASVLLVSACGKECDSCQSDAECAAEGLLCVTFSNGSRRCGSGQGSTTCRVP